MTRRKVAAPTPTRGPRARAAETAAATAELARRSETAGRREQRRRLEGTIRSVSASAHVWQDHPSGQFVNAAARAWEIVDDCKRQLDELDARGPHAAA